MSSLDFIKVLKGLRNGLYYGGKVRIVHAIVMTLLFKRMNKKELISIIKVGFEHARNLGLFVFGYKATCILLEKLVGKRSINNFIAGFLFGGLIFGRKTPVILIFICRLTIKLFCICSAEF